MRIKKTKCIQTVLSQNKIQAEVNKRQLLQEAAIFLSLEFGVEF